MRNTLCVVILACLAVSAWASSKSCYEGVSPPPRWSRTKTPSAAFHDKVMQVPIALKQRNMDVLADELLAISTPSSPRYSQHYTLEQLTELIAPREESVQTVVAWAESNGLRVVEIPPNRDFVIVEATLGTISAAIGCEFAEYKAPSMDNKVALRCVEPYCLPTPVADAVDVLFGVHGFPYGSHRAVSTGAAGSGLVTPPDLYTRYNATGLLATSPEGVMGSQAVAEFESNFYSPSDVQDFFKLYTPSLEGQVVKGIIGKNDNNTHNPSIEANLDVMMIMTMGPYIDTYFYSYTEGGSIFDQFLTWTYSIGNETNPPLVQSCSYGEYGGKYPNATVERVSNEWMKAGARGVSVLFASGDDGVGCGDHCTELEFPYPSSPYVTLVGATQFGDGYQSPGERPEVAATLSSGGFSDNYDRPSWQEDAIKGYFAFEKNTTFPKATYDINGRGLPDTSACGMDIAIVANGKVEPVGGTSCASPMTAGFIASINSKRMQAGKNPLGWLNPWIYANPHIWNDMTSGDNTYECCKGFEAVPGWDAVTGFGSPNFGLMLENAMALP